MKSWESDRRRIAWVLASTNVWKEWMEATRVSKVACRAALVLVSAAMDWAWSGS
jgi:hypothetical protein